MPASTKVSKKPSRFLPYADRPFIGKYKVLSGKHNEGGVTYFKGEIVNSKSDLEEHNSPGSVKFQKVPEDSQVSVVEDEDGNETEEETIVGDTGVPNELSELYKEYPNVDSMKVPELEELAEIEEIELSEAKNKEQKLDTIKTSFAARKGESS